MTTLLTTAEAAERLKVSRRAVQEWIATGALVHIRRGRYLRIDEKDLEAFVEKHKSGGNVLAMRRGAR
jgi:excisionase family DNA binding protein